MNNKKLFLLIFGLPFMTLLFIYICLNVLLDLIFRLEYPKSHYANKIQNYFFKYLREIDYFNFVVWFMVVIYLLTKIIE